MIRTSLKNKGGTDHATYSHKIAFRYLWGGQPETVWSFKKAPSMMVMNQFQYFVIDKLWFYQILHGVHSIGKECIFVFSRYASYLHLFFVYPFFKYLSPWVEWCRVAPGLFIRFPDMNSRRREKKLSLWSVDGCGLKCPPPQPSGFVVNSNKICELFPSNRRFSGRSKLAMFDQRGVVGSKYSLWATAATKQRWNFRVHTSHVCGDRQDQHFNLSFGIFLTHTHKHPTSETDNSQAQSVFEYLENNENPWT